MKYIYDLENNIKKCENKVSQLNESYITFEKNTKFNLKKYKNDIDYKINVTLTNEVLEKSSEQTKQLFKLEMKTLDFKLNLKSNKTFIKKKLNELKDKINTLISKKNDNETLLTNIQLTTCGSCSKEIEVMKSEPSKDAI